jgi:hypothetical protein
VRQGRGKAKKKGRKMNQKTAASSLGEKKMTETEKIKMLEEIVTAYRDKKKPDIEKVRDIILGLSEQDKLGVLEVLKNEIWADNLGRGPGQRSSWRKIKALKAVFVE